MITIILIIILVLLIINDKKDYLTSTAEYDNQLSSISGSETLTYSGLDPYKTLYNTAKYS